ncbi:hypothetical protein AHOG_23115 [Actinoalloteichus hoggarensis]|uniref:Uncharacterized protein n=1 Tax=Actinoalloteichus hoggarensis TaxID=1470176 RepID=A0A221W9C5_9PSEU|nr:hypothetical protein AHOG_23115 [Actinoalloteichus hoggarensis]
MEPPAEADRSTVAARLASGADPSWVRKHGRTRDVEMPGAVWQPGPRRAGQWKECSSAGNAPPRTSAANSRAAWDSTPATSA